MSSSSSCPDSSLKPSTSSCDLVLQNSFWSFPCRIIQCQPFLFQLLKPFAEQVTKDNGPRGIVLGVGCRSPHPTHVPGALDFLRRQDRPQVWRYILARGRAGSCLRRNLLFLNLLLASTSRKWGPGPVGGRRWSSTLPFRFHGLTFTNAILCLWLNLLVFSSFVFFWLGFFLFILGLLYFEDFFWAWRIQGLVLRVVGFSWQVDPNRILGTLDWPCSSPGPLTRQEAQGGYTTHAFLLSKLSTGLQEGDPAYGSSNACAASRFPSCIACNL